MDSLRRRCPAPSSTPRRPGSSGIASTRPASAGPITSSRFPRCRCGPATPCATTSTFTPITEFFEDCESGRLPAVSLVTPDIPFTSEGEFEDDQVGEAFTATVFDALTAGPQWARTLFILTWDEGGGFYDHVPPPAAVAPDDVPPDIHVPSDQPGGFDRYGFRVPCLVASPYSKPGHVSSVISDHTSILAAIEQKWGLAPLTRRDAAAAALWDFL